MVFGTVFNVVAIPTQTLNHENNLYNTKQRTAPLFTSVALLSFTPPSKF
jgi:hypothetical protein